VSTYRQFIIENSEKLKQLPAPKIAQSYYLSQDPYLFNMDSALARGPANAEPRVPACDSLYDVFVNILEDEWVRGLRMPSRGPSGRSHSVFWCFVRQAFVCACSVLVMSATWLCRDFPVCTERATAVVCLL
jgi:hypothetical protein